MDEPLYRCDECRKHYRGTPHRTVVNRRLCRRCASDAFAVQLGGIVGAKDGVGSQVMYAVAFRNALRRTFRRGRGREDPTSE
jgi:aromatic ring-cleaving dioxygenase